MRLFVSYARVDRPYCVQIVSRLDIHEVWYDQRLYAGQHWWKEILRRLDWCEGFLYLLSPDSVNSEYCLRELAIATKLKKQIIPILIQSDTVIPDVIEEMQYVDLSGGLNVDSIGALLNSIYVAEMQHKLEQSKSVEDIAPNEKFLPVVNSTRVVSMASKAMERGAYDQAIFLLKHAKEHGFKSRFINIDALIKEAETALDIVIYEKEAKREYSQIVELMETQNFRQHACEAFIAFQKVFPEYDPEGIGERCKQNGTGKNRNGIKETQVAPRVPPPNDEIPNGRTTREGKPRSRSNNHVKNGGLDELEFVLIPDGYIRIDGLKDENYGSSQNGIFVSSFAISKYPITIEQYQVFIEAPDGYCNPIWWRFSSQAARWHQRNPTPKSSAFSGHARPRENVSWYDAYAFCNWLSTHMNTAISLPGVFHWQRAVQGNDDRIFPWGNEFDTNRCNTRESQLKMTTQVGRYPNGCSPYDVYDLAGNVWEWCIDTSQDDELVDGQPISKRAVVGGSFVSPIERAQINFRYYLNPETIYSSIGFRVVQIPK